MALVEEFSKEIARARTVYEGLAEQLRSAKTVYVGGVTGPGGGYILGECGFFCSQFLNVVFVDDYKSGTTLHGREVISGVDLAHRATKADILINNAQSIAGWNHFERQAASLGIPVRSTLEVLAALFDQGIAMDFQGMLAVYGPPFHRHTLDNIELYEQYRDVFVDDLSRMTFDDLLRYRLTGNPNFLNRVAVGVNYGPLRHDSYVLNSQFFSLSDDEVFIDAGALTGETTDVFVRSVGGNFRRIVLFEPNPESIVKSRERIAALNREFLGKGIADKCDLVEKGLYSFTGELTFSSSLFSDEVTREHGVLSQSAHVVETGISAALAAPDALHGVIKVPVTTLDEVMGDDPCTFIKYEIEGSEVDALHGATRTIKRNAPKMALSIYHRPQDLELILQYVQDLDMGYNMAVRAHNAIEPAAVVLYCWKD